MNPASSANYSYPYDASGPPRDPMSKFVLPAVVVLVLLLIGGGYFLFFQGLSAQSTSPEEIQLTPTQAPHREYMMMGGDTTTAPTPTEVIIEATPTIVIEEPTVEPTLEISPTP